MIYRINPDNTVERFKLRYLEPKSLQELAEALDEGRIVADGGFDGDASIPAQFIGVRRGHGEEWRLIRAISDEDAALLAEDLGDLPGAFFRLSE